MCEYPLRVVGAMLANGCSLRSIDFFIEGRTDLSEEDRSALWLVAWGEISREARRRRVAELIEGERRRVGRIGAYGGVDRCGTDKSVGGRNVFGLGVGA